MVRAADEWQPPAAPSDASPDSSNALPDPSNASPGPSDEFPDALDGSRMRWTRFQMHRMNSRDHRTASGAIGWASGAIVRAVLEEVYNRLVPELTFLKERHAERSRSISTSLLTPTNRNYCCGRDASASLSMTLFFVFLNSGTGLLAIVARTKKSALLYTTLTTYRGHYPKLESL